MLRREIVGVFLYNKNDVLWYVYRFEKVPTVPLKLVHDGIEMATDE